MKFCLIESFRFVLDYDFDVGHDGTYVKYPERPPPYCYASHNINEICAALYLQNISVVTIDDEQYFNQFLNSKYRFVACKDRHAIGYKYSEIFDLKGECTNILDFKPEIIALL